MEDTIESTEKALAEGNVYAIPDSLLIFDLEFRDLECSRLLGKIVSSNDHNVCVIPGLFKNLFIG